VFASTRQVYGRPRYLPVDEKHVLAPVDVNGINKLAGEWYHILYNDVYNIRACALRLTNTYGPRMRVVDARQTFLGIWIRSVLQDKTFQVWGGSQLRDFTFVDDVVDVMLRAALSSDVCGRVLNVGGCAPLSLRDLAERLVSVAGSGSFEVCAFPPEREKIDIGSFYSDDSMVRRALDWAPRWSLEAGLRATVEYFRENLTYYC
jgi:UDP-glucose 4-epimerase